MAHLTTPHLLGEYEGIITALGKHPKQDQIVSALVREGDWTEKGARDVLRLALRYGTSVLRNALALAEAIRVEDGAAGL